CPAALSRRHIGVFGGSASPAVKHFLTTLRVQGVVLPPRLRKRLPPGCKRFFRRPGGAKVAMTIQQLAQELQVRKAVFGCLAVGHRHADRNGVAGSMTRTKLIPPAISDHAGTLTTVR